MNLSTISSLFYRHRFVAENLHKTCVANAYIRKSTGTRNIEKARKYKRPEDLEDPFYYGIGPKPKVEQVYQSLIARGFGKELPSYTPSEDVEKQLHKLCKTIFGTQLNEDWKEQRLDDRVLKFKLLNEGIELFKKNVPNSLLHKMQKVSDVYKYFSTPVDGVYHYDALVRDSNQLPPNLHIMPDTPRFNPATDTFFDGITALPDRKRTVFTKTREKFEKVIEWPNI